MYYDLPLQVLTVGTGTRGGCCVRAIFVGSVQRDPSVNLCSKSYMPPPPSHTHTHTSLPLNHTRQNVAFSPYSAKFEIPVSNPLGSNFLQVLKHMLVCAVCHVVGCIWNIFPLNRESRPWCHFLYKAVMLQLSRLPLLVLAPPNPAGFSQDVHWNKSLVSRCGAN